MKYVDMGQEQMPYEMYDPRFDPGGKYKLNSYPIDADHIPIVFLLLLAAEMMGYPPPYGGGMYYMEEDPMHFGNPMGPPRPMPYGVPVPFIPSPAPQQLPSPPVSN